jgi:hypothetical protein
LRIGCAVVTKANRQHNIGSPIIAVDVLSVPSLMTEVVSSPPVVVKVERGHGIEQNGQYMSENEIYDENHHQIPLMLTLRIYTYHMLDSLQLV